MDAFHKGEECGNAFLHLVWDLDLTQPALCVPSGLTAGSLSFQPHKKIDNARSPGPYPGYAALFKLALSMVTF